MLLHFISVSYRFNGVEYSIFYINHIISIEVQFQKYNAVTSYFYFYLIYLTTFFHSPFLIHFPLFLTFNSPLADQTFLIWAFVFLYLLFINLYSFKFYLCDIWYSQFVNIFRAKAASITEPAAVTTGSLQLLQDVSPTKPIRRKVRK